MNMINISVAGGVPSPVEGACGALTIGNVGDNGATGVALDFSAWAEEYGAGAVTLGVRRKGDAAWYPVALTVTGAAAVWIVSNIDTAVYGIGEARFAYTVGEVEKRSAVFRFFVDRGLGAPEGTPPDPYEDWVERLEDLGAETLQNAQDAQEAAEAAAQSATGAGQSATAAAGSAENAASSASSSASSASAASTSAGSASGSASSAASSAASAAASASSAESSASTASQKAGEAATSASAASTSAASAAGSASNAASSATAASASATAAGAAQTAAETAASHYPQITDGYWYVWDVSTGAYVNTNVKAEGEDGEQGPQGPKGDTGATGETGPQGAPGPNQVTTNTETNITGILKGDGSTVTAATPGTDYATPQQVNAKYTKPAGGIPATDMAQDVQTSLGKADTALQEHQSLAAYRTSADQDVIDAGKLGTGGDGSNVTAAFSAASSRANIATGEKLRVIFGKIAKWFSDLGTAAFRAATNAITQGSTDLVESGAVYTGLAGKLNSPSTAGTADQILGLDSNLAPVWQDRDRVVTVTGTTPTITAVAGVRYVCGEVTTLDITLPASGVVDVTFESGLTPTVLTVTPPSGVTVRWANGFDPTSLEADTTYEINIADGLGVAAQWT